MYTGRNYWKSYYFAAFATPLKTISPHSKSGITPAAGAHSTTGKNYETYELDLIKQRRESWFYNTQKSKKHSHAIFFVNAFSRLSLLHMNELISSLNKD